MRTLTVLWAFFIGFILRKTTENRDKIYAILVLKISSKS